MLTHHVSGVEWAIAVINFPKTYALHVSGVGKNVNLSSVLQEDH